MSNFRKLNRSSRETDANVKQKILSELQNVFPVDGNFFRLDAKNFQIKNQNAPLSSVKKALSSGSSVMASVTADISLYDKNSKKVIDRKRRTIMRIPEYTKKGSFVIEGNSYTIPYQQRLRPGVYTLKKRNGEINSMFNLGKGRNFNMKIDKGGNLKIKVGSLHVSLYSILKDIGITDNQMEAVWGKELLGINKKSYNPSDAQKFLKAFKYSSDNTTIDNAKDELKKSISESTVSPEVVKETLGVESDKVNPLMILAASKKLLGVYNGTVEQDDRENMMFKQVMAPEDMLAEAFRKNIKEEVNKIKFKLGNPSTSKIEDVIGTGTAGLTRPVKNFIVSSKASRLSEEYNPLMMHTTTHLITPMGEGGVGDTRALNLDTKAVHPSHLGFIDPIVSPEGAAVGITLAVTDNSYIDEHGAPAIGVINAKTGKKEVKKLSELWNKNVAYPVSKERIKEDGIMVRRGEHDFKAKTKKDVDYILENAGDMHAPSSNVIPLINSSDANRTNMAQKHVQQALPLKNREIPNVSVMHEGEDFTRRVLKDSGHIPFAPVSGTVSKIDNDYVYIKDKNGKVSKVDYTKDMPLARKTFISHDLKVKVGDKVKEGQHLADSNFTRDGHLALGKNMRTAWLSMPGNRNDGIVISESAAEELTSEHMYKEAVHIAAGEILDLKRFQTLFPDVVSKWGASNYDSRGIIKKGAKVVKSQPLVFKLAKSDAKQIKTKLERVMHKPYKAIIDTWHHADSGEIVEVNTGASEVRITAKVESKAKIGDKLSARQGNKGVITKIVPDDEMPKNKKGEQVDILMTSAGVISRTNGGSLIEAGLGKIADKTKKRYIIEHYSKPDNLKFMEDEAKKNKVELYEELINPETGKPFPKKVFVGNPMIMKLFKDSESGMSAVGVGATDVNEQPLKGGDESASSYSNMEVNALLAHGAKNLLHEAKHIKGQKNDEFFDAFRRGAPLPRPSENFASEKFKAYLSQLGVNVHADKNSTEFSLVPMTDKEIVKKSAGAIRNADTVYAKDGKIVKGGLFDESIFGGPTGKRYGHIKLNTEILNPLYKEPISRLLGMTADKLDERIKKDGFDWIKKDINKIDPAKKVEELKKETENSKNPQLANRNIKLIKFLNKAKDMKGKVSGYAFISNVPVIPPVFRPVTKDANGDVSVNDLNLHYQDIHLLSDTIKNSRNNSEQSKKDLGYELFKSVGAMYGTEKSPNKKMVDKNVKGVLDILGGDTPKQSFAQKNLLRVKQFMSGRGVIKPARTDIGIDEIEIPEKIGLKMYEPHISRRLSRAGFTPIKTKEMIESKDPIAIKAMNDIAKEVPVVYNRAPSLWKHNMVGGFPKFVKGNTIGINPLMERSLGADYDGDTVALHVPVTQKAITDVKEKILPSKNIFTDEGSYSDPDVVIMPDQDATLGIYKSSRPDSKKIKKVSSISELKKKINSGEIKYNDIVSVG